MHTLTPFSAYLHVVSLPLDVVWSRGVHGFEDFQAAFSLSARARERVRMGEGFFSRPEVRDVFVGSGNPAVAVCGPATPHFSFRAPCRPFGRGYRVAASRARNPRPRRPRRVFTARRVQRPISASFIVILQDTPGITPVPIFREISRRFPGRRKQEPPLSAASHRDLDSICGSYFAATVFYFPFFLPLLFSYF